MKKGQININYKAQRIGFDGSEKLVGSADRYSTISYDAIVAYAAKAAAVPESSITMAMEAIFDAMNYFVLNGHSVQIPNLGTFSIGIRAKSTESEAEFTANFGKNLKGVAIHFLPDPGLKQQIASTAISTSVDETGYEANGVVAVTSALFGAGQFLFPMNAGRPYALEGLTRAVLNGTRLSDKYIGRNCVRLTFIDGQGQEQTAIYQGQYVSQSYNSIVVNLKRIAENFANFYFIKKLELVDGDSNVIFEKTFAAPTEEVPAISAVSVDNKPVPVDGTFPFEAGKAVQIRLLVANIGHYQTVSIGGTPVSPSAAGDGYLAVTFTPSASGNYPIAISDGEHAADVYNLSFGEAGGVSVAAVTANGDPLANGSTTNIIAGEDYVVQITGAGLGDLTDSNFVLPQGTTIAITSQSNTLIVATIGNAQAGDFKVVVDEEIIFAAALVAVTPGVSVTGWKLTANGATQQLTADITADPDTGEFGCFLVGEDIDELLTANFAGTGFSSLSYTPATGELTGVVDAGTRSLVITYDNVTIATLSVTKPSGEGDDGFDKD